LRVVFAHKSLVRIQSEQVLLKKFWEFWIVNDRKIKAGFEVFGMVEERVVN